MTQLTANANPNSIQTSEASDVWKVTADQLELAIDVPADASIEDILSGRFEARFNRPDQSVPKLDGYGKTVWGRLSLHHTGVRNLPVSLVAKYPQLDRIDWFVVSADRSITRTSGGQFVAQAPDQIANRFPVVATELVPGET